jgi:hypothetical protein
LNVGEISSILAPVLVLLASLDHPIRSHQHIRRDCEADLLGRFEIATPPVSLERQRKELIFEGHCRHPFPPIRLIIPKQAHRVD